METGKTSGTTSLLSKKVKIEGNIQGDEDLRVEGHFKGTIKVVGDFFVGQSGVVEADVEADNIVIQGQITGNVLARKQLEIQSSGQLLGDCQAKSIDIREGAIFEGRSSMLRSSAPPAGSTASSSTSAQSEAKVNPK
jgi:cytoskeletal protein CcmA (bactofilin family)